MASIVFRDGAHAFDVFSVNEKRRVGRIHELVLLGNLLEEPDQLLLRCWMKMQARLIKEEHGVFVTFFGLNQKN